MQCRCSSISNCNSDLNKLSSMISNAKTALGKANSVRIKLNTCASHFQSAYSVNNTADAAQAARVANDQAISYINSYLSELNEARSDIESMLSDYEDEDERYHAWEAEQARKEEEERRRQEEEESSSSGSSSGGSSGGSTGCPYSPGGSSCQYGPGYV